MSTATYISRVGQQLTEEELTLIKAALVQMRAAYNKCHDPKTGRFCPKGGGGLSDAEIMAQPSSAYTKVNPGAPDTMGHYLDSQGNFTPERMALHDAIVRQAFVGATPVDSPEVLVLGGGPASGKSTSLNQLGFSENRVTVDPDHVRTLLPEYGEGIKAGRQDISAFTHEEASYISKRIAREAVAGKYNMLMDGTGDSSYESLQKKVAGFRARGAKVTAVYSTIATEEAISRMKARGAKTGRFVPVAYLREIHKNVSGVFGRAVDDGLFDAVKLFDNTERGGKLVLSAGKGKAKTIHDQGAWVAFLAKANE